MDRCVHWVGGGRFFSSTEEAVEYATELKRRIAMTKARRTSAADRRDMRQWQTILDALASEFGYQTIRPHG